MPLENIQKQIKGKSFLVTGGAGFIGSNLCKFYLTMKPNWFG